MTAIISNPATTPHVITWPLLPDDFVLPDDPVEDEAQPRLAAALTSALSSQPSLMQIRRSYTPHREGGVPPLVMEFLSESDC